MKYRKMKKIWAIPFAFTATMIVGAYSVEAEEVDEPLPQETEVESPAPAPVEEVPVPEVKDVIETTTESRDITYKIEYVYEDGTQALDPTVSVFEIEREKNTNQTTGEVTYGEWDMTVADFMDAPEIEGYKADKDPGSVWIDGFTPEYNVITITYSPIIETTKEYRDLVYVIEFVYEDGTQALEPWKNTITIERDVTTNKATGEVTYGEWDMTVVDFMDAPEIEGYKADKDPGSVWIDGFMPEYNVITITYSPIIETTKEYRDLVYVIEFVYEDGTQALEPWKNTITIERDVTTNKATGEVTYGEWDMTVVDFMDAPEIEGYKADKNPGSVWFDDTFEDYTVFTVTYNKLPTKTIERVIHFQDENGNTIAEDLVQRIEIEWDGQGTFESVQAPSIRGYTSNQASVDASQVTYDSDNEDIVITYKKEVAKPTILEKIVQRIDCALSTIRNTVWSLYSIFKRWF